MRPAQMARRNPEIDYAKELSDLRKTYAEAAPQARLNVIRQRLRDSEQERGPTRLVTLVSCVEALARSLIVAASHPRTLAAHLAAYAPIEHHSATWLVAEVLRLRGKPAPEQYFSEDTWPLFTHAAEFRNMIVHEATYFGQDKSALLQAAEEVLHELVRLAGLRLFEEQHSREDRENV